MIYILEGADGSGKSTLANAIAEKTKGHILHSSFHKDWNIKEYHTDILKAALILNKYQDVIIDRWSPSEHVYGNVFRSQPSYDVFDFLWMHQPELEDAKWIMCRNDKVVENHIRNASIREEMFDDMSVVASGFDQFVEDSDINWIEYDFDKVDMNKFVEELVK